MKATRAPAVAGTFYPATEEELRWKLQGFSDSLSEAPNSTTAVALIAPHAGYVYSGAIAAQALLTTAIPSTCIVLCPNHTGLGKRASVWSEGSWKTPLGEVAVNQDLAQRLLAECPLLEADQEAHENEHAIEVELPFLKFQNPDVQVVPIVLGRLNPEQCETLGRALAWAIQTMDEKILLVASTDMSHYVDSSEAETQDAHAIEKIKRVDGRGLYQVVAQHQISMCGFIPTSVVLFAASRLGYSEASVLAYGNSGEVNQDFRSVVSYLAARIG